VENMSYFQCPDCGGRYPIFGESHIDQTAAEHGIANIARMPIDPAIARACDRGDAAGIEGAWLDAIIEAIKAL
jgi:hypothetical protein